MKTRARHIEPLSRKHFNQIIRRPESTKKSMYPLWAITWNLRGRRICKLGTASMLAMSYHPVQPLPGEKPGSMIELLCITAATDPEAGVIHYSDIRMAHDFSLNPHPGATGRILDPRDEDSRNVNRNDRPNGSWVRLALEVDRQVVRLLVRDWERPVVPKLPRFLAGFQRMEDIEVEVTPAIIRDIAIHMNVPVAQVEAMTHEEKLFLAKAHWPKLWVAPWQLDNDSNLWRIDARYVTQFGKAVGLFEDFSELMGVNCWNPARNIQRMKFTNPTRACAATQGIDLAGTLAALAAGADAAAVQVREEQDPHAFVEGYEVDERPMTPTQFACGYDEAVDRLMLLRNCVRGSLGIYSNKFSDDEVNFAVMNPNVPMIMSVDNPGTDLARDDVLRLMRAELRTQPHIAAHVTEDDLLAAAANPQAPLYASQMCHMQVMRRDPRMAQADAFRFTPQVLGRDRVYANLWAGCGWSPMKTNLERYDEPRQPKQRPVKKQLVDAAPSLS